MKNLLQFITLGLLLAVAITSASAANRCPTTYYAAQDNYYPSTNADEMNIISHAEPDLPQLTAKQEQNKKQKSSTSIFSWLTKSHTMPSLHFIEFIELFGDEQ